MQRAIDIQKLLMVTDGTVTDLLETYFNEPIQLIKLEESQVKSSELSVDAYEGDILQRKILLQGANTEQNYIYAQSLVLLDNLDQAFANELQTSKTPIGKLWAKYRVETFKEVVAKGVEPMGDISQYFAMPPTANVLYRTYHVFSNNKLIMVITEKFSETLA